jgi:hypothetical protein
VNFANICKKAHIFGILSCGGWGGWLGGVVVLLSTLSLPTRVEVELGCDNEKWVSKQVVITKNSLAMLFPNFLKLILAVGCEIQNPLVNPVLFKNRFRPD